MTQALNLANFANNLNTSGQTSNSGLQNSSITVNAGTGLSGGGTPSLGGSVTLNNAGVTSVSAGTGISVSASTGGVTITNSAPAVTAGEAKAWVAWTGNTSPSIISSYNVSSVTYVTTGTFNVNLTNALTDSNFACFANANYTGKGSTAGNDVINVTPITSSQAALTDYCNGGLRNSSYYSVAIFR